MVLHFKAMNLDKCNFSIYYYSQVVYTNVHSFGLLCSAVSQLSNSEKHACKWMGTTE